MHLSDQWPSYEDMHLIRYAPGPQLKTSKGKGSTGNRYAADTSHLIQRNWNKGLYYYSCNGGDGDCKGQAKYLEAHLKSLD